jgi:hypothetical protein
MAQIGTALRSLLDNNNLRDVKIIGYEHNWVSRIRSDSETIFAHSRTS